MTEDDSLQAQGRAPCAWETGASGPAAGTAPARVVPRSGGDVLALLAAGLDRPSVEGPLRSRLAGDTAGAAAELLEEECLDVAFMSDFLASLAAAGAGGEAGVAALRIASGGPGARRRPRSAHSHGPARRRR